ncbi:hypothetical protein E1B28_001128 [Marasmius oreades]|uniref:Elongator complex protein 5 n=1 Tax=Marasmius oreades TaxID=181124 RepID=A0A9P8AF28_9AGAR|nr:uncharacterized protein E1B28_001128 [Marasmius oreades]KAG7099267.1 hypothetical protein E1B28_001128 [Marasmius oreades]
MLLLDELDGQRLILLQSSFAQSSLPILRHLVSKNAKRKTFLVCFLYPPSSLVDDSKSQDEKPVILDLLDLVPTYNDDWRGSQGQILTGLENEPDTSSIDVVIDSLDTLLSDIGSVQAVYAFLRSVLSLISSRSKPSRLILHLCIPCPLTPLLTSTSFFPSLAHLISHPPEILTHLAKEYLTFPPPISPEVKFWSVFIPLSERDHESERLVLQGRGSGNPEEFVVEIILRGGSDASGRRKGVQRTLEGWNTTKGYPMPLNKLTSLSDLWKRKSVEETAPDPTQIMSFNLQLTPSQQEARAKVPLPYVLEGAFVKMRFLRTVNLICRQDKLNLNNNLPVPFSTNRTQRMTLTTMIRTKIWTFSFPDIQDFVSLL